MQPIVRGMYGCLPTIVYLVAFIYFQFHIFHSCPSPAPILPSRFLCLGNLPIVPVLPNSISAPSLLTQSFLNMDLPLSAPDTSLCVVYVLYRTTSASVAEAEKAAAAAAVAPMPVTNLSLSSPLIRLFGPFWRRVHLSSWC